MHRHRIVYSSAQLLQRQRRQEELLARRWSVTALLVASCTLCMLLAIAVALLALLYVPGAAKQAGVLLAVLASEVRTVHTFAREQQ